MASPHLTAENSPMEKSVHFAFHDRQANMYRTSYSDMTKGNETAVMSNYPSGYGGHVPTLKHDVLFVNMEFHKTLDDRNGHPDRDAFPHFGHQIAGNPVYTENPRGARTAETALTTHPATMKDTPWAVQLHLNPAPSHRTSPRTIVRKEVDFYSSTGQKIAEIDETAFYSSTGQKMAEIDEIKAFSSGLKSMDL